MNPVSSTEVYKDKILSCFQSYFTHMVEKGEVPSYQKCLDYCSHHLQIKVSSKTDYLTLWYEKITTLRFIKDWINDDSIREIIFHNHQNVQIEISGTLYEKHIFNFTPREYQLMAQTLCLMHQQNWNYARPFVSFSAHGLRISMIHQCLSTGIKIFLRKLNQQSYDHFNFGFPPWPSLIKQKLNILIAGATGSGKTTFMGQGIASIPRQEHVIVMEDTREIFTNNSNHTFLKANDQYSLKNLCATTLRLRPDRIILGEIRGHEVSPFLLNLNSGHKGAMASIHANSAVDALDRIATLFCLYTHEGISYAQVLKLACKNIDRVIFLENKKVIEVIEILGADDCRPLYRKLSF